MCEWVGIPVCVSEYTYLYVWVVGVIVLRWSTAPAIVNAFYSATKNQISN